MGRERYVWAAVCAGLVLYLAAFGFNSLTRMRYFSEDSMSYVNVARNFAAGRGFVRSAVGYNQPAFPVRPERAPMTGQAPLYPLLIGVLARCGLPAADAALLVPVAAYGLALLGAFALARSLFDLRTAWIALVLLLLYAPLQRVSRVAWTEAPAIALTFGALWAARRAAQGTVRRPLVWAAAAGAAAGVAFCTRFAMLPLAVVVAVQLGGAGWRRRERRVAALTGFACMALPAVLVLGRNLVLSGRLFGAANPSTVGLAANLAATLDALLSQSLAVLPRRIERAAVLVAVLALVGFPACRAAGRRMLRERLLRHGRCWAWVFPLLYLVFLVVARSRVHFDAIDFRLTAPAGAVLTAPLAATIAGLTRFRAVHAAGIGLALAVLLTVREVRTARHLPPYRDADAVAASERLRWLAAHTTPRDLVIADDAPDIPFYLGSARRVVSFAPRPYMSPLRIEQVLRVAEAQGPDGALLVIRKRLDRRRHWDAAFGPFVADLMTGEQGKGPRLRHVAELADAQVFRVPSLRP